MRIYYLNLEKRQDRRAFMERQFATHGLQAERVAAVMPAELDPDLIERHCAPNDGRKSLLPVELACSISHQRAWQAMLADGEQRAVVLEDDVFVSSRLPAMLAAFEANGPPHDIVRIETRHSVATISPEVGKVGGIALHRFENYEIGAAGYVISAACAERLLADAALFSCPIDDALFDPRGPLFASMDVVRTVPGLCIPAECLVGFGQPGVTESDIHASRVESVAPTGQSLWRRIIDRRYEAAVELWKRAYRLADRLGIGGRQRFIRFEP